MPRLLAMLAVFISAFVVLSAISKMARPPRPKDTWRNDDPKSRTGSFFKGSGADTGDSNAGDSNASNSNGGNSKTNRSGTDDSQKEIISSMPLSRAQSLRDALTGAPINTQQSVWQCAQCQTLYNNMSIQALLNDNHGRCIQCNHTERCLVVFTNDH